jgi:uncharacterized membrane protein YtjA (UPF0391 family)
LFRPFLPAGTGPYLSAPPSLFSKDCNMLRYALIFLVLALVASVLGFGGIAGDAAWIARVLLVIFVVMFLVSLVMGRRAP